MTTATPEVLLTDLVFPEGARWHEQALWFSDVHADVVLRFDPAAGRLDRVTAVPGGPSGLGFLPDGRLLVAAGHDRTVRRLEGDGRLVVHADLSGLASWHLNDMAVDRHGRAWVGNYGDDSAPPAPPHPANLVRVDPDGTASVAATEMLFANGIVTTADGGTLIVAETRSTPGRLTAFTILVDGTLTDRRTLCAFGPEVLPDGLAVAADDAVWVASPFSDEVLRVDRDGTVTDRIAVPHPYAVALGGRRGEELFVCSADHWEPDLARKARSGRILRLRL